MKVKGGHMKIVDLNDPNKDFPISPCGLVLGNFDGVHLGHLALIERLKEIGAMRDERLPLGAFCFEKHPSSYLGDPTPLLSSNEEKIELFQKAGLDFVIFGDFAGLKNMTPEEFIKDFLIEKCKCFIAVCGYNYSFGAKGAGTPDQLKELFEAYSGRTVSVVSEVTVDGRPVSSTAIRAMLERGQREEAERLLGRRI